MTKISAIKSCLFWRWFSKWLYTCKQKKENKSENRKRPRRMVIDFKVLRSVKYYYLHLRNGTEPPLVFHGETDRAFSTSWCTPLREIYLVLCSVKSILYSAPWNLSRFNGAERSAMERSLGCREMEAVRNPIKLSRVKERNGAKRKGLRKGGRERVRLYQFVE